MSGLVISAGGLQKSLKEASFSALLQYLGEGGANEQRARESAMCDDILWILQEYKKCDRAIVPCLKVDTLPYTLPSSFFLAFYVVLFKTVVFTQTIEELLDEKMFQNEEVGF